MAKIELHPGEFVEIAPLDTRTDPLMEEMARVLADLSERCKRARVILRDGPEKGHWGILDTEEADEALQKYRGRL